MYNVTSPAVLNVCSWVLLETVVRVIAKLFFPGFLPLNYQYTTTLEVAPPTLHPSSLTHAGTW